MQNGRALTLMPVAQQKQLSRGTGVGGALSGVLAQRTPQQQQMDTVSNLEKTLAVEGARVRVAALLLHGSRPCWLAVRPRALTAERLRHRAPCGQTEAGIQKMREEIAEGKQHAAFLANEVAASRAAVSAKEQALEALRAQAGVAAAKLAERQARTRACARVCA